MRLLAPLGLVLAVLIAVAWPPGSRAQLMLTGAGRSAPGQATCTFPAGLTSVIGRYKAADATTSGGNVTAAIDSSGAGHNLTVSGTVPYTAASVTWNSQPIFDFNATGGLISNSFAISGQVFSFWSPVLMNALGSTNAGLWAYAGSGQANDYDNTASFNVQKSSTPDEILWQSNNSLSAGQSLPAGTKHRIGMTFTAGGWTLYKDGAVLDTSGAAPSLTTAGHLGLGARYASSAFGFYWYGQVPEFVVTTSTPNGATISALDSYFTCQYGT